MSVEGGGGRGGMTDHCMDYMRRKGGDGGGWGGGGGLVFVPVCEVHKPGGTSHVHSDLLGWLWPGTTKQWSRNH